MRISICQFHFLVSVHISELNCKGIYTHREYRFVVDTPISTSNQKGLTRHLPWCWIDYRMSQTYQMCPASLAESHRLIILKRQSLTRRDNKHSLKHRASIAYEFSRIKDLKPNSIPNYLYTQCISRRMTKQIRRRKIKRTPNKQDSLSAGLKAEREREKKKRFAFASLTGRGPRPRSLGTGTRSPHTAIVSRPNSSPRYTYLARCGRLAGEPLSSKVSNFVTPSSRERLMYDTHPRWTRGGPVLEENNENAAAPIIYLASRS